VSSSSDAEFASKVAEYLDIDSLARYMAITAWLSDLDGILGPGQNYYLFLHPKAQQRPTPVVASVTAVKLPSWTRSRFRRTLGA